MNLHLPFQSNMAAPGCNISAEMGEPYHPKWNCMAPRPKFLYYKPKSSQLLNNWSEELSDAEEEFRELNSSRLLLDKQLTEGNVTADFDAPYDPKSNYLAPRPRFLYYKPKSCQLLNNWSEELSDAEEEFRESNSSSLLLDKQLTECNVTADFDAPYDPKSNYLAPRPRFLYYKPKSSLLSDADEEFRESNSSRLLLDKQLTECNFTADFDAPYDPKSNYLAPRPRFLYYKPKSNSLGVSVSISSELSDDGSEEEISGDLSEEKFGSRFSDKSIDSSPEEQRRSVPYNCQMGLRNPPGLSKPFWVPYLIFLAWVFISLNPSINISFSSKANSRCLSKNFLAIWKCRVEAPILNIRENNGFTNTFTNDYIGDIPVDLYDSLNKHDEQVELVPLMLKDVENNEAAKKIDACEAVTAEFETSWFALPSLEVSEDVENNGFINTSTDNYIGDIPVDLYDSLNKHDEEVELVPLMLKDVENNEAAKKIDACEAVTAEFETSWFALPSLQVSGANHSESNIDHLDMVSEVYEIQTETFEAKDATVIMDHMDQPDFSSECAGIGGIHTDSHLPQAVEIDNIPIDDPPNFPSILKDNDDNDTGKKIDACEAVNAEFESSSFALPFMEVSDANHLESNIDHPDIDSKVYEIQTEILEAKDVTVIMDHMGQPDLNSECAETGGIHTDSRLDHYHAAEIDNILIDDPPNLNYEVARLQIDDPQHFKAKLVEIFEIHTDKEPVMSSQVNEIHILPELLKFISNSELTGRLSNFSYHVTQNHIDDLPILNSQVIIVFVYILLCIIAGIYANLGKSCLRNGSLEINVLGESCPSKLSNFQMSSHENLEKKQKKIYRTKFLPSSDSMSGSASYGSFITYEKIASKNGSGDAAIVAPVRRSWRIKTRVVK